VRRAERQLPWLRRTATRLSGVALLAAVLVRHSLRPRRTYTLSERLAMLPRRGLPLEQSVMVRWNDHQVPYIDARSDRDLAVTLGLVHAHLRLGQIELMRRLAQGRVSEMIGPIGVEIDQLMRTLDLGRAVPAILAEMPYATRDWLEAFVVGLNHHIMHVRPLPTEFELFDLRPEPWNAADILTLGRLASADVNWIPCFKLLRFRSSRDWPQLWRKLLAVDGLTCGTGEQDAVAAPFMRSGSNSFVVAASRSASGAAMIASDPHLGIMLPNAWLLAAGRSPSFQATGLMLPGLPFVALGRNPWIAWGGTSLHASSSELVAVPAEEVPRLEEREAELNVRWGRKRRIRIRESRWGPIVSDIGFLKAGRETLALRWMGHYPSDECTAMLAANRARNWNEFRTAFEGFAIPGQNMLCADSSGQVGRLMAVRVPRRSHRMGDDIVVHPMADDGWDAPVGGAELPQTLDPDAGFITSANERPPQCGALVGDLFSAGDRKRRLEELLTGMDRASLDAVARIQRDTFWEPGLEQRRQLLAWLENADLGARQRRCVDTVAAWDGYYASDSRGALAFELWCFHLARLLVPASRSAIYSAAWGTRRLIWDDIRSADPQRRTSAVREALRKAANEIGAQETWGDRHRLRLSHPLALVPMLGRAWTFIDLPSGGGADTLMKTAHKLTRHRHATTYGSMARHIADLSDLDRNYFALLGGQDGWLGSTTSFDQVALWQQGKYITLPLHTETARAIYPHVTRLEP
jgi:penicillin amidase